MLNFHEKYSSKFKPWLISLSTGLYVLYMFLVMAMPNSLNIAFVAYDHLSPETLNQLSSLFFWANFLFLLPVGVLVDRFSTRKMLLLGFAIMVLGMFIFSLSTDFICLFIGRFLMGVGGAFSFIVALRMSAQWLKVENLGLITGILTALGFIGGAFAQLPLQWSLSFMGLSKTLWALTFFGVLIWVYFFFVEHDNDWKKTKTYSMEGVKLALLKPSNYLVGIYAGLLSQPIFILGGLLGISFLKNNYHFSLIDAGLATSLIFIGGIVGTPLIGLISDKFKRPKLLMIIGSLLTLLTLISAVMLSSKLSLFLAFFFLGITTSTQALSYPIVYAQNPHNAQGTASSIISLCAMGITGIVELFITHLALMPTLLILVGSTFILSLIIYFFSHKTYMS